MGCKPKLSQEVILELRTAYALCKFGESEAFLRERAVALGVHQMTIRRAVGCAPIYRLTNADKKQLRELFPHIPKKNGAIMAFCREHAARLRVGFMTIRRAVLTVKR